MKHKFTLTMIIIVMCGFVLVMLLPHTTTTCGEKYRKDVIVSNAEQSVTIAAQLAATELDRELGLGSKKCIGSSQAMLFMFDEPGYYGIWMKNMMFPIDIVWLDYTKEVVGIEKNVSPDSFPHIYTPVSRSQYVVELHGGATDVFGIDIGDQLHWQ